MNFWVAQNVVYGRTFSDTILAALSARPAAALIAAGKLRLSKDPAFAPNPASTVAALAANEADFSGYVAGGSALALSAAVNLSPSIQGVTDVALFTAAVAVPFVSNAVTGWWVDDGANFVAGEAFPNGQTANFATPGDFLQLVAELPVNLLQATA